MRDGEKNVMSIQATHDYRNTILTLSLLLSLPLPPALAQPDDPPGRWQLETLTLRDESKLAGLIQSQTDEEIDFAEILQPPGKPMYAVIRGIPREDVAKIEQLPPDKHRQLVERFARFRSRAVIEAGRMEQVELGPGPSGATPVARLRRPLVQPLQHG